MIGKKECMVLSLVIIPLFLAGCQQGGFDKSIICSRVADSTGASKEQALVGSFCSNFIRQQLSPSEIEAVQNSDFSGILAENSQVDFSCTPHQDFFGSYSFTVDYLIPQQCAAGTCQQSIGENNVPKTVCGNVGQADACAPCTDNDPCTIDVCVPQSEGAPACSFVPRCPTGSCNQGNCGAVAACPNGICDEGENSENCPSDCQAAIACPGKGYTGPNAAPRNKFEWSFSAIPVDACDNTNPAHINCDALQFLIAFLQKMNVVENQWNQRAIGNQTSMEKVGTITATENGLLVEFDAAMLSDNVSERLLNDFSNKESGFMDAPSWYSERWQNMLPQNGQPGAITVEYDPASPVNSGFQPLHPAGAYHVKTQVTFQTPAKQFFNAQQPTAIIQVQLNRVSDLQEETILDLALDSDLGTNDWFRDYGIQWFATTEQAPIPITNSRLTTADYVQGLQQIEPLELPSGSEIRVPVFIQLNGIIPASTEPVFFQNAPPIFQTLELNTHSEANDGSGTITSTQKMLQFHPLTAMPLLAFVPARSSMGTGFLNGLDSFGFYGPWKEIARQDPNCDTTTIVSQTQPNPSACGEQPNEQKNNLFVLNNSSANRLLLSISYAKASENGNQSVLEVCNSGNELSNPFTVASSQMQGVELSNPAFSIRSLEDLIKGIRENKVCVYTETTDTGQYPDEEFTSATTMRRTTYFFNTNALLNQIKPRLNQYTNNPSLGPFVYCG
jgi:hypothetical protein